MHSLFSNYLSHDRFKVELVVQSYFNQWKKTDIRFDEKYIDSFIQSYPFTPEVIDMFFNRVLVQAFQGNRGPFCLLGRVVQLTADTDVIISTSYFDFHG